MAKLLISFARRNVRLRTGRWFFKKAWPMRFEWIALMAYKRLTVPADQAWVSLEEIARLPSWDGKSRHDTSTYVGRYLQSAELERLPLVMAETTWSGPYRLNLDALAIKFDLRLQDVRNRLRLHPMPASIVRRAALLQFTYLYARAQRMFFRGKLERKGVSDAAGDNAYQIMMGLTKRLSYSRSLRFLALLSAVDILFRLGRYRAARLTLTSNRDRLRHIDDGSLKARFHLKVAWAIQRGSSGRRSDRLVEAALQKASFHAQNSGDRATLGMLAYRTAGYRTKNGLHLEAINQLALALEADLITGNYDNVQNSCANFGSIVHRLGPEHYDEARCWLLLAIAIARMMGLGRDNAHAEMILGKIYAEQRYQKRSRWLLERAQRIADRAGNRVNLADVKMVWAFWYERFGTRRQLIETLRDAVTDFRNLYEFDARQKERYMEQSFPDVWQQVLVNL